MFDIGQSKKIAAQHMQCCPGGGNLSDKSQGKTRGRRGLEDDATDQARAL